MSSSLSSQLTDISHQLENIEDEEEAFTEDITAFSLIPEGMEQGDKVTWKNLVGGLKKYHSYEPGQPTEIPVKDDQPYGVGVDLNVGNDFELNEFDSMVENLWTDVKGYSMRETMEKIREWEDLEGFSDVWDTAKELPKLGAMIGYEKIIGNNLTKSYAVDENSFGVRLYEGEDSNYVNFSAGLTNYDLVLEKAGEAAEHLDERSF